MAESFEGTIFDRQNKPVPGVRVSLSKSENGQGPSTYTNQDGRFFFWDITPGSYIIEVYWGNDLVYRQQHSLSTDDKLDIWL
ncbi:MAG: carboxypeptidase-like regulatory domain-containing protein [Nitrososphaera sp.]|nr:carboxypeptidase-like regulatory domain-containing protein [Nitrososphaera sp.]